MSLYQFWTIFALVCRCTVLLKAITASSDHICDLRMHHTLENVQVDGGVDRLAFLEKIRSRLQSVDDVLAALSAL